MTEAERAFASSSLAVFGGDFARPVPERISRDVPGAFAWAQGIAVVVKKKTGNEVEVLARTGGTQDIAWLQRFPDLAAYEKAQETIWSDPDYQKRSERPRRRASSTCRASRPESGARSEPECPSPSDPPTAAQPLATLLHRRRLRCSRRLTFEF